MNSMTNATYDLIFNNTKWAKKYKYFTVDMDGSGILWTKRPSLEDQEWYRDDPDSESIYAGQFNPEGWRDSLLVRKSETKPKQKKEKTIPTLTRDEAATLSKNVAVGTLLEHIRKSVYESASRGLRTCRIPTSCFVPRMLNEEDFNQIIVQSGYDFNVMEDGDFELRWR